MRGFEERQGEDFKKHFEKAKFSDEEAASLAREKGEVVAFVGRRGLPDHFVVAFATPNGRFGPYMLNRLVAYQLRNVLQENGF
jgi:hypothetical protein